MENIIKLKGVENWTVWKFSVSVILKSKKLYDIVIGNLKDAENWEEKDNKAQEIIVARLECNQIMHVLTCTTAHDMWRKLTLIYEPQNSSQKHILFEEFYKERFDGTGSVTEFISKLQQHQMKLKQVGEEVSDSMIVTKVLMSLPEQYRYFVSAFESASNQSLQELTARLNIEQSRISKDDTVALYNKAAGGSGVGNVKCYGCHKFGHIKKDCREKICNYCKRAGHTMNMCYFRKQKEGRQNRKQEGIALQVGDLEDWVLDSGASEHMCNDKNLFETLETISKSVRVGNGDYLKVSGIGSVLLEVWNGTKWLYVNLHDVLYVPGLKTNLFSVGKTLDNGYKMITDSRKSEIYNLNGECYVLAERVGSLYKMRLRYSCKNENENNDDVSCHIAASLSVWHKVLVHQNLKHVKEFLSSNNIKFVDDLSQCRDCVVNKQHRISFKPSESRAKEVCELVHADLCGPFEKRSLGGARYFLLLKDDYSSFRSVYFLKHKSEVCAKLKEFIHSIIALGYRLQVFRSDNGLEFVNKGVQDLLKHFGVKHERAVVYTPQQNGRAERENRTLVEAARTLLNSKGLGKELWAEAVNTSVYVLNRTGSSSVPDKTPFELWSKNNKAFDSKVLKEFGVEVATLIPKHKRSKLDIKSKVGILVGYGENTKGYRIYFPSENKVEILCDITEFKDSNLNESSENKIAPASEGENGNSLLEQRSDEEEEDINEEENRSDIGNGAVEHIVEDTDTENIEVNLENCESEERNAHGEENENETGEVPGGNSWWGRLRSVVNRPRYLNDYECLLSKSEEPQRENDVIGSENVAIRNEEDNKMWILLDKLRRKEIIDSKWRFKMKRD